MLLLVEQEVLRLKRYDMMKIEKLAGTEPRLYSLVAPLVMSVGILRLNNNYPFKTSRYYTWFVATDEKDSVLGFMPVEARAGKAQINNYFISGDDPELLSALIGEVVETFGDDYTVCSVTHSRHKDCFRENGFLPVREWKLYVKMEYCAAHERSAKCV